MSDTVKEGSKREDIPSAWEEGQTVLLGSSQQVAQPICNVNPLEASKQFQGWPRRNIMPLG